MTPQRIEEKYVDWSGASTQLSLIRRDQRIYIFQIRIRSNSFTSIKLQSKSENWQC